MDELNVMSKHMAKWTRLNFKTISSFNHHNSRKSQNNTCGNKIIRSPICIYIYICKSIYGKSDGNMEWIEKKS